MVSRVVENFILKLRVTSAVIFFFVDTFGCEVVSSLSYVNDCENAKHDLIIENSRITYVFKDPLTACK